MGSVPSTAYNFSRRMILRYNVQERALKALEREKLPTAPRHSIPQRKLEENTQKTSLKFLHEKSEELTEHLKKVYLTSTSTVISTPSIRRPLPKKENERPRKTMFYEPETPAPGCVTLTKVVEILYKTQHEEIFVTPTAIANEYKLDKKDARNLTAYYSLFRLEKFDFMNQEKDETKNESKLLDSFTFGKAPKQLKAE